MSQWRLLSRLLHPCLHPLLNTSPTTQENEILNKNCLKSFWGNKSTKGEVMIEGCTLSPKWKAEIGTLNVLLMLNCSSFRYINELTLRMPTFT